MRRRILNLVAIISLALATATITLWLRSGSDVHHFGMLRESWPETSLLRDDFFGFRLVEGRWLIYWDRADITPEKIFHDQH